MNEKIDKYFKLLHPEYDKLSLEEQKKLTIDRTFIEEHLEEIENEYQELRECFPDRSEKELLEVSVRESKIETYFNILYPDLSKETDLEIVAKAFFRDKAYIETNLEEIENEYQELREHFPDRSEKELLEVSVRESKIKTYFNILYPDLSKETDSEIVAKAFFRDEAYIETNLEEVESAYSYFCKHETELSDKERMEKAINTVKESKKSKEEDLEERKEEELPKNSEEIVRIDEAKFAQIYSKAKGITKSVFSKIKSFFNIKSNDRNDKSNDEI